MLKSILQSIITGVPAAPVARVAIELTSDEQHVEDSFAALEAGLKTCEAIVVAERMFEQDDVNYAHVKHMLAQADSLIDGTLDLESIVDEDNIDLEGIKSFLKAARTKLLVAIDRILDIVRSAVASFRTGFGVMIKDIDKITGRLISANVIGEGKKISFKGDECIGATGATIELLDSTLGYMDVMTNTTALAQWLGLNLLSITVPSTGDLGNRLPVLLEGMASQWQMEPVKLNMIPKSHKVLESKTEDSIYYRSKTLLTTTKLYLWTDGHAMSLRLSDQINVSSFPVTTMNEEQIRKGLVIVRESAENGARMLSASKELTACVRDLKTALDTKNDDASISAEHLKAVRGSLNCYKVYTYDMPLFTSRVAKSYLNWIKASLK